MLSLRSTAAAAAAVTIFTGSIARSAKRRYISYSEGDFEVFRPAGAPCCTVGGEICKVHSSIHHIIATIRI